ncbi:hypothetical protein [Cohnella sp. REN36]|nr:hypothetical protein [Cohnella sp. REN36]MCC3376950.1 hypothetical protein [Cohnella sp. REN36]
MSDYRSVPVGKIHGFGLLSLISKPRPEKSEPYEDIYDDGPAGDEIV